MINIAGRKAAALAALYNASRQQGLGLLDPRGRHNLSEAEAQDWLDQGQTYFDYINGRVMKVDFSRDQFDPFLYNRDNGAGAAERALATIK